MAARLNFKKPFDTAAAEDWFRQREAIKLPKDYKWTSTLKCDSGSWGPFSSRTTVTEVSINGTVYPLRRAVTLRSLVKYVVDIVDGYAEFNVDVSLGANFDAYEGLR